MRRERQMAVISGAPWASAGAAVGTQQWNHLFRGVETFAATFLQMMNNLHSLCVRSSCAERWGPAITEELRTQNGTEITAAAEVYTPLKAWVRGQWIEGCAGS